jgi:uncharacterized repeat protein (TIGR02543 family)
MMKNCLKTPVALSIAALLTVAAVLGLTGCPSPSGGGEDSYTVAFDALGGTPAPQPQSVAGGATVSRPPDPAKEGYVFEGWHASLEDDPAWDFAVDTVTADITLHAKWKPAAEKVTAVFDAGGGSPVPAPQSVESGAALSRPPDPAKEGYVFEGWHASLEDDPAWDFAVDTVTADITLHAKWKPQEYLVAFNSQGGSAVDSQTVPYGGKAAEPGTPVNGSLALEGWYKESALATKWDFAVDTVQGALTLHARWVEVLPGFHLVAFNSQGGSAVESQTIADQGKVEEPEADPERPGYRFAGWHKEAAGINEWDFVTDTVVANTTLYAKWIPIYVVSFDSRGGSDVESIEALSGAAIAKPADPVLDRSVFAGWHKEAAGTNKWDFSVDTITVNTTLYAKWIPIYVVSFDSRGGSDVESVEALSGAAIAKPTDPVLDKCVFAGWRREEAGGAEWDFETGRVTADMTLYAHWTVTVSFAAGGGTPAPEQQTLPRGGAITEPGAPVLEGKSFMGWHKEEAGTNKWDFATDRAMAAMTLYARWDFVPATGIRGIAAQTSLAQGAVVDLNRAAAEPPNATYRNIVWSVASAGAGVDAIPGNKRLVLTETGTLTLTAVIVSGTGEGGDYAQDFSFTVDRASVSGEVGLGDSVIRLYANGESEPLPENGTIRIPRGAPYYISIDGTLSYSNIVWRLNGRESTAQGGTLYLDTKRVGTVALTVEAELGGVAEDGACAFIIE